MGTDLEKTIERINEYIDYYFVCCDPENKDEVMEAKEELFKIMRGE